jgi:hypothetical protein
MSNPSKVVANTNSGSFVDKYGFALSYWMYIVLASLPKSGHFD